METDQRGGLEINQTLCFQEEEDSEPDDKHVIISTSSDSNTEKRVTLTLIKRSSKCGEEVIDPAKKMVGMLILGLGLGTVLSVLGYMLKNQLEVCADPRRNL